MTRLELLDAWNVAVRETASGHGALEVVVDRDEEKRRTLWRTGTTPRTS
jgi:hypothetical protein